MDLWLAVSIVFQFSQHQPNKKKARQANLFYLVHPEGFEPTTLCSEDRCSNPLSYGCVYYCIIPDWLVCTPLLLYYNYENITAGKAIIISSWKPRLRIEPRVLNPQMTATIIQAVFLLRSNPVIGWPELSFMSPVMTRT